MDEYAYIPSLLIGGAVAFAVIACLSNKRKRGPDPEPVLASPADVRLHRLKHRLKQLQKETDSVAERVAGGEVGVSREVGPIVSSPPPSSTPSEAPAPAPAAAPSPAHAPAPAPPAAPEPPEPKVAAPAPAPAPAHPPLVLRPHSATAIPKAPAPAPPAAPAPPNPAAVAKRAVNRYLSHFSSVLHSSQHQSLLRKVVIREDLPAAASPIVALSPSSSALPTLEVSVPAGLDLKAFEQLLSMSHPDGGGGKLSLALVKLLLSEHRSVESSSSLSRQRGDLEADLKLLSKLHSFASKSSNDLSQVFSAFDTADTQFFEAFQKTFRAACKHQADAILAPHVPVPKTRQDSREDPNLGLFDSDSVSFILPSPPLPPIVSSLQSLLYEGHFDVGFLASFCNPTLLSLLLMSLFEAGLGGSNGEGVDKYDMVLTQLAVTRAVGKIVHAAMGELASSSADVASSPPEEGEGYRFARLFLLGPLLSRPHCGTPPLLGFLHGPLGRSAATREQQFATKAEVAKTKTWIKACEENKKENKPDSLLELITAGEDALAKQRSLQLLFFQSALKYGGGGSGGGGASASVVVMSFFAHVLRLAAGRRLGQGNAEDERLRAFQPADGGAALPHELAIACADLSLMLLLEGGGVGAGTVGGTFGEERSYVAKLPGDQASRLMLIAGGEKPRSMFELALLLQAAAVREEHRRIEKSHRFLHEVLSGQLRIRLDDGRQFNPLEPSQLRTVDMLKMFDSATHHSWQSVFFGKDVRPNREEFVAGVVTWCAQVVSTGDRSDQMAALASIAKSKLVFPQIKFNWGADSRSSGRSSSSSAAVRILASVRRGNQAIACVELLCKLLSRPELVPSVLDQSTMLDTLYDIVLSKFSEHDRCYDLFGGDYDDSAEKAAAKRKGSVTTGMGNTDPLYVGGASRGHAGAVLNSESCVKALTNALLRMYVQSQSVEGQDVDIDNFEKFTLRLKAQRLILALVHHPAEDGKNQVSAYIDINGGREMNAFLAAVCANAIGIWTFLRDNGLDKLKQKIESGQPAETFVKQVKSNMTLSKQSLLFLSVLLRNDPSESNPKTHTTRTQPLV